MPNVDLATRTLTTWQAADGRDLQIRQMDSNHILNCLDVIERKSRQLTRLYGRPVVWRPGYNHAFWQELDRRRETAIYLRLDDPS